MRAVLIDEQQCFRESFRIAVWHEAQISIVAAGDTAREVIPIIESERPDLVVTDLILRDADGVSVARELTRRGINVRTMILTVHRQSLFVREAFDAGVAGYALKEQPLAEVIAAMRSIARGARYVSPQLKLSPLPSEGEEPNGVQKLSFREREIFRRIISGQSSRHIAKALCISLKTVETHRLHINRKLGVHSPADLIRLAALRGLLIGQPDGDLTMMVGANVEPANTTNVGAGPAPATAAATVTAVPAVGGVSG